MHLYGIIKLESRRRKYMQTIIITLNNGKKEEYVKGIKVKEILNKMSKEEREDAILIKYNNKKVNLETELKKNGTLQI